MMISRSPRPDLTPFVDLLWASDDAAPSNPTASTKEIVLPTGATHMVFRLGETPLQLYATPDDITAQNIGHALIGGPRADAYVKATSNREPTVGIMLRPGAAELLLGVPVLDLAERHTRIDDILPYALVDEIRTRLQETLSLEERLSIIEGYLLTRLPNMRDVHPLIMHSLEQFRLSLPVGKVVEKSGFSHRYFTKLFTEAVGLKPKTYCRVLRFGRILERIQSEPNIGWASLAIAEGYADQAHMNRDFKAFTSLTPGAYRKAAPTAPRHIPLP